MQSCDNEDTRDCCRFRQINQWNQKSKQWGEHLQKECMPKPHCRAVQARMGNPINVAGFWPAIWKNKDYKAKTKTSRQNLIKELTLCCCKIFEIYA